MTKYRHDPETLSDNPFYVHIENDHVPWTPLTKPLAQCQVALITMGGLHLPSQHPFKEDPWYRGDFTYRELPRSLETAGCRVAHSHYENKWVLEDLNCLLPLDVFRALEAEGVIGRLADTHFSFMGAIPNPMRLVTDVAPEVAGRLRAAGVDAVVLSPA